MHSIFVAPLLFSLVAAIAVDRKANYNGYQVVRLEVGNHLAQVTDLIKDLSLSTWNGGPRPDSTVDVVVPAAVVSTFEASTAGKITPGFFLGVFSLCIYIC